MTEVNKVNDMAFLIIIQLYKTASFCLRYDESTCTNIKYCSCFPVLEIVLYTLIISLS